MFYHEFQTDSANLGYNGIKLPLTPEEVPYVDAFRDTMKNLQHDVKYLFSPDCYQHEVFIFKKNMEIMLYLMDMSKLLQIFVTSSFACFLNGKYLGKKYQSFREKGISKIMFLYLTTFLKHGPKFNGKQNH